MALPREREAREAARTGADARHTDNHAITTVEAMLVDDARRADTVLLADLGGTIHVPLAELFAKRWLFRALRDRNAALEPFFWPPKLDAFPVINLFKRGDFITCWRYITFDRVAPPSKTMLAFADTTHSIHLLTFRQEIRWCNYTTVARTPQLVYDNFVAMAPQRGVVYRQYTRFGTVKAGFDSRLPDTI